MTDDPPDTTSGRRSQADGPPPLGVRVARANAAAPEDAWPGERLELLVEAGAMRAAIPVEFGGLGSSGPDLLGIYLALAEYCLLTTFVLTQRNGACQRLAGAENESLRAEWLPALARGERFATVGISHLTTSRQHLARPAVTADPAPGGFTLRGEIPWVTGAAHADVIVTGGTCLDGRQILVALRTAAAGVVMIEPPRMLALNGSRTGSVRLEEVFVPDSDLIAGPVENVMRRGSGGGTGSLTTSALAIGHAAAILRRLAAEAENRDDLRASCGQLADEHKALAADIARAALMSDAAGELSNEAIRQRANSLALRSSQALLAASKGAGFLTGHPAERGVREAMFFLVWSCPRPVLNAQLAEFACTVGLSGPTS
jgi:alkylation response protein AidB-like acyl-CoA dehydrogenase